MRPLLARLLGMFRRRRADEELAEEIAAHLDFAAADHMARGMSASEARLAAARRFGGVLQTKEAYRDRLGFPLLESIWQDVRYALRACRTRPGFTALATIPLALGIGTNSAIFSIADAELLRPLPVRDPGAVVTISLTGPADTASGISYPNYRDLRAASRSFEGLVAYRRSAPMSFARSRQDVRELRMGTLVSDNFFEMLGVQPAVGRLFTAREGSVPNRDAVVVLGYDFWKNVLAEDSSIISSAVWINGIAFSVVGVAAATFTGPDESVPAFFLPIMMAGRLGAPGDLLDDRTARSFAVKGRLKSGVSQQEAEAEMAVLWKGLEQQYPESNRNRTVSVRSQLQERIREEGPSTVIMIGMMMALVMVVLLIACANVASLMLGRGRARSREMAIRLALGVGRFRLCRQLLIESLVVALIGCAIGLGFAYGGLRLLRAAFAPTDLRVVVAPQLDQRVLTVSLLAAVASAVLCGLAPAWQSLKTELVSALKAAQSGETTRHRTMGRNMLVVAQIALSMVLLVVTAGLLDGFRKVLVTAPGFRREKVMTMGLDTSIARYETVQTRNFYRDLIDGARGLPGVASVALTSWVPLDRGGALHEVSPEGYRFSPGQKSVNAFSAVVDEHYFSTMDIQIIRGRAFTADDNDNSRHVAIVNEEFAKTYWPDQEPIGKRIRLNDGQGSWLEVVGLTKTGKYLFVAEPPIPFLYLPFAQHEQPAMTLLVETMGGDPAALAGPLRAMVRDLDVNLPTFNVRTLASLYERRAIEIPWRVLQLVGTIGGIGLILALVGSYGLVSYSVARRTREIGIRMAIGASKPEVLRMVLRHGLVLSMTGLFVGGTFSIVVARLLAAAMVGLGAPHPTTYIAVPVTLFGLTMVASYVPARRASRMDPLRALRYE